MNSKETVLNTEVKNIYLCGDTLGIPEIQALKNIAITFICMSLFYTIGMEEVSDAVLAFEPGIVYSYHYRG